MKKFFLLSSRFSLYPPRLLPRKWTPRQSPRCAEPD